MYWLRHSLAVGFHGREPRGRNRKTERERQTDDPTGQNKQNHVIIKQQTHSPIDLARGNEARNKDRIFHWDQKWFYKSSNLLLIIWRGSEGEWMSTETRDRRMERDQVVGKEKNILTLFLLSFLTTSFPPLICPLSLFSEVCAQTLSECLQAHYPE